MPASPDRIIPLPKKPKEKLVCKCGDATKHIAYLDRNDEVVIECPVDLDFIKFPKGTK